MKWYCKLIGHTFVYKTELQKIAWNAGKDQAELHITAESEEPHSWLECVRCGARVDNPTREQIKKANCNVRQA